PRYLSPRASPEVMLSQIAPEPTTLSGAITRRSPRRPDVIPLWSIPSVQDRRTLVTQNVSGVERRDVGRARKIDASVRIGGATTSRVHLSHGGARSQEHAGWKD